MARGDNCSFETQGHFRLSFRLELCMIACIIGIVTSMPIMEIWVWRTSWRLWIVSYVSHLCLSREAKWCSSVTAVTLTITMRVNIQGWSPCCGIQTWNNLMLNGLSSCRPRKQRRLRIRLLLLLRETKRSKLISPRQRTFPKSYGNQWFQNTLFLWKTVVPAWLQRVSAWDLLDIRLECFYCETHHLHLLLLLCSQDVPSAISTAVAAPGLVKIDPLQEVDPKLLVSSRGKGPPRRCHHLTHKPAGLRVNVHHILCAWCEHADSVDTHTLCGETFCVSTASTDDGATWR